jgi:hypothetical protein
MLARDRHASYDKAADVVKAALRERHDSMAGMCSGELKASILCDGCLRGMDAAWTCSGC